MNAPFILIAGVWLFAFLRVPMKKSSTRDVLTECMLACILGFLLTLVAANMKGSAP